MSTISSFKSIGNKHDVYRGIGCIKKFYKSLREHAMKIINLKKQTIKLLTQEQQESYENAKICHFCKENFESKFSKNKKYRKVTDHCHYTSKIKRKYQHDDKNC